MSCNRACKNASAIAPAAIATGHPAQQRRHTGRGRRLLPLRPAGHNTSNPLLLAQSGAAPCGSQRRASFSHRCREIHRQRIMIVRSPVVSAAAQSAAADVSLTADTLVKAGPHSSSGSADYNHLCAICTTPCHFITDCLLVLNFTKWRECCQSFGHQVATCLWRFCSRTRKKDGQRHAKEITLFPAG